MSAIGAGNRAWPCSGLPGFFFSVVLLIGLPAASADGQTLTWGLQAGVNAATFRIAAVDLTLNPTTRFGLLAGAFVDWPVGGRLGVQADGLVSQRGTVIKDPRFDGDLNVRVNYLDLPVLARYRMGVSPSIAVQLLAGAVLSRKLSDEQRIGNAAVDEAEKQRLSSSDLGLAVGGAVLFRKTSVDLRYVFGVKNINDDRDRDELTVRTRALSVSIGRRF